MRGTCFVTILFSILFCKLGSVRSQSLQCNVNRDVYVVGNFNVSGTIAANACATDLCSLNTEVNNLIQTGTFPNGLSAQDVNATTCGTSICAIKQMISTNGTSTQNLFVDNIHEFTAAHGVSVVNILNADTIHDVSGSGITTTSVLKASAGATVNGGTLPFAGTYLVVTGDNNNADQGQFIIRGATNGNNQLIFAMNTNSTQGTIESFQQGGSYKDLLLQPNGGRVGVGIQAGTPLTQTFQVSGTFSTSGDGTILGQLVVSGSAKISPQLVVAGDSTSYASPQLIVEGQTNSTLQLQIGYRTDLKVSFLQSTIVGGSTTDIFLQPSGGNVGFGGIPYPLSNTTDIGTASSPFRNLYLSGTVSSGLSFTGALQISGNTGLPAATPFGSQWIAGGFASPVTGRFYVGDGNGGLTYFSKRTGSTTTDLFAFTDGGIFETDVVQVFSNNTDLQLSMVTARFVFTCQLKLAYKKNRF